MAGSAEELAAALREIRERVRARYPTETPRGEIPLPDLMPLLHARDAAEGKVAAIGSVNPRPPGLLNAAIQRVKRLVARALDWHVREQIEFNRAAIDCVQATLEAFNETNRALVAVAGLTADFGKLRDEVSAALEEFRDMRSHWNEWRHGQETRIANNEITFLKNLAESHSAFQHRLTTAEEGLRDLVKTQHSDFTRALANSTADIQKRLWDDLERVRAQFEALIHYELRLIRQRLSADRGPAAPAPSRLTSQVPHAAIDWVRFAERFRGSEESIRERHRIWADRLAGRTRVLDLGCGRGELLEVLREAGIPARGIDSNPEFVAVCRAKGLDAQQSDVFDFLAADSEPFDAIVATHVVEHLPPLVIPRLLSLAHARLAPGEMLILETPNPECLASLAWHFYADPTHTHPVPASLLQFLLEEAGFGGMEILRLHPVLSAEIATLPDAFRESFFGALDYAIVARKL